MGKESNPDDMVNRKDIILLTKMYFLSSIVNVIRDESLDQEVFCCFFFQYCKKERTSWHVSYMLLYMTKYISEQTIFSFRK